MESNTRGLVDLSMIVSKPPIFTPLYIRWYRNDVSLLLFPNKRCIFALAIDNNKGMKHSETAVPMSNHRLDQLSDDEILQGFKDANARIVREYYYGYCRIAYCIKER